MDLHSLLNNQKENTLSFSDIKELFDSRDIKTSVEKFRSNTAFSYPNDKPDAFQFFNLFLQLILFMLANDAEKYTQPLVRDALRTFMNGAVKKYGLNFLKEFPCHSTQATWNALKTNGTILLYLYGMELALIKSPDVEWMRGILHFMHSESSAIMTHLWLNVCCVVDDMVTEYQPKELYLQLLEKEVASKKIDVYHVQAMWNVLKEANTDFVAKKIDQQVGAALPRPPFTEDEFKVSYISLESYLQSNQYPLLSSIYQQTTSKTVKSNPLLTEEIMSPVPSDKYAQTEAVRRGTLSWIQTMSAMLPSEFDMYLNSLILQHYPTDRKTVLDLLLADWALRDRFHRHLNLIVQAFTKRFKKINYNRRMSPFYAFVQLFNIPDENKETLEEQTFYQMKSGAYIDLSTFSNCSDFTLMNGCFLMLKELSNNTSRHVAEWMTDSLQSASADIIKQFAKWLCDGVEAQSTTSTLTKPLKTLLKTCVAQSSHIVPTLLDTFTENSLSWLLKPNNGGQILLHYFDDGPQVSKDIVVTRFFMTKNKACVDLLLGYLREHMSGTDPKLPRSRAWFKNHFLCNILQLVGEDQGGKSVASCIFRQLFKTRDDFEWYFSTPLVPAQPIKFQSLALANSHDIYAVKNTGLAAMFQELVRLNDSSKKERLLNIWFDLWTTSSADGDFKFTVPVSWILYCAGLYDQAPVLVKQMIKKFVEIGMHPSQEQDIMRLVPERKFLDRMMDLVLLSDTPEPDSLFELVLNVTCDYDGSFNEINTAIIDIMIELSEELELEILASSMPPPPPPKFNPKRVSKGYQKKNNMSRIKLGAMMKKHEEKLEKYLTEKNEKINNAIKALTTLAQRIFSFLLRLLNNTSSLATVDSTNKFLFIRQQIQQQLINIPLYYEPLAKLTKLITQPEDLHEDIQTAIELSVEYLKKQSDKSILEASQKILK